MNDLAQAAVLEFLTENLTREDLEDILRNRKVGFYGRLLKKEMAKAVAGLNPDEVYELDRQRQSDYRARRQEVTEVPN